MRSMDVYARAHVYVDHMHLRILKLTWHSTLFLQSSCSLLTINNNNDNNSENKYYYYLHYLVFT